MQPVPGLIDLHDALIRNRRGLGVVIRIAREALPAPEQ